MPYAHPEALVSSDWLAAHLDDPRVRVVDGSFKMPGVTPTAKEDYDRHHISGAVFFDIDEIADTSSSLPHMLPDAAKFASRMRKLGLGDEHLIVVYDSAGLMSAPRVWWTIRAFGHRHVAVLDGGLPKWLAEDRATTTEAPRPRESHFTASLDKSRVRSRQQMQANLESRREQVVDARAANRFEGSVAEPRPGLRSGHIPGSRNLPFDRLSDPASKTIKSAEDLARLFEEAGIRPDAPLVATCGSGVTASVLAFAWHLLGRPDAAVYDGSWSEWGLPGDTPVATGPAGKP